MIKIEENKNLSPYLTLKSGGVAQYFAIVKSKSDLMEAIDFAKSKNIPIFILGGGSNLLVNKQVNGLLIKNEIKGIEVIEKKEKSVIIEAKSGENWSYFVNFAVENNFYGLENLFLIYGTVGAAPVQNIGAYGVELEDVFHSLKAINLETKEEKVFSAYDCQFGYRDSIFKNELKGKYFIYSVTVKLSLMPCFKLDYGSIKDNLKEINIDEPKLKDVIDVIAKIRNSKLPNPYVIANAGSFFKNPEVDKHILKDLQKKYEDIPFYPLKDDMVKIPAGWLIEKAGFKGKSFGPVRMYEKQALILVNEGGTYEDVLALSTKVKEKVKELFGLDLTEEVNII